MATKKHLDKWEAEAVRYSDNPEYKELYVKYRMIAKQADQRLVRLEAYSHDTHFTNVLKYAYAAALQDIHSFGGNNRFNTAPPKNLRQLEAKVAAIEKFLEMPTSTKQGILKTYKQRAETTNKEFGSDFTWEELANYWEGVGQGKFTYDKQEFRAMIAIKKATKKNKDIIKQIKEGASKNIKVSDDEVQNEIAKQLIKNGITPTSYFGKYNK